MLGVYVTHVHTPGCLCVQIIGETTTRTLEYLLEDLTQFYNSRGGDSYVLKKPIIGQVYIAGNIQEMREKLEFYAEKTVAGSWL